MTPNSNVERLVSRLTDDGFWPIPAEKSAPLRQHICWLTGSMAPHRPVVSNHHTTPYPTKRPAFFPAKSFSTAMLLITVFVIKNTFHRMIWI